MLKSHYSEEDFEAGCDEAGRGCLAGAVFAAAVILPKDYKHPSLTDSKKMNPKQREILRFEIEKEAISFGVAKVEVEEIDKINILNASILGMQRALDRLQPSPKFILVDGNRFKPYKDIPYKCVVKGDATYLSIAAASILAKTYRDDYMEAIHQEYPLYHWDRNKAYATALHYSSIEKYGITPYHRKSFKLYKTLTLFS